MTVNEDILEQMAEESCKGPATHYPDLDSEALQENTMTETELIRELHSLIATQKALIDILMCRPTSPVFIPVPQPSNPQPSNPLPNNLPCTTGDTLPSWGTVTYNSAGTEPYPTRLEYERNQ